MTTDDTPHGWQRDKQGNLYRSLTEKERRALALSEPAAKAEAEQIERHIHELGVSMGIDDPAEWPESQTDVA